MATPQRAASRVHSRSTIAFTFSGCANLTIIITSPCNHGRSVVMKVRTIATLIFLNMTLVLVQQSFARQAVSVSVVKSTAGTLTLYTYQVTNMSKTASINDVTIGLNLLIDGGELRQRPVQHTSPLGWQFTVIQTDETPYYMASFNTTASAMAIPPGETSHFVVAVAQSEQMYETAHVNVVFTSGEVAQAVVGGVSAPTADVNGDQAISCDDVRAVKDANGQRCTVSSAPVADVNRDCVVDIRDLAMVSRLLPAGTRCQ
jgi:hypothetical protein